MIRYQTLNFECKIAVIFNLICNIMANVKSSLYGIDKPRELQQCNFTENFCSSEKGDRLLIQQKENLNSM